MHYQFVITPLNLFSTKFYIVFPKLIFVIVQIGFIYFEFDALDLYLVQSLNIHGGPI